MGFQFNYRDGWVWRDSTTPIPNYGYSHLTTYEVVTPPREGWICPRCGRVNAPWVATCSCYTDGNKITCGVKK